MANVFSFSPGHAPRAGSDYKFTDEESSIPPYLPLTRGGALDYFIKPFTIDTIRVTWLIPKCRWRIRFRVDSGDYTGAQKEIPKVD